VAVLLTSVPNAVVRDAYAMNPPLMKIWRAVELLAASSVPLVMLRRLPFVAFVAFVVFVAFVQPLLLLLLPLLSLTTWDKRHLQQIQLSVITR
jgi:hypothetical protein